MILQQVYKIENNQVIINLPPNFKNKKRVLVTLDDVVDTYSLKIALLKKAATDPLFLEDINEINEDFKDIDCETV